MRLKITLLLVIVFAVSFGCKKETEDSRLRIGMFLYADHTAINASRDGFLDYTKEHPEIFTASPEIVVRNVGGDATKLGSYADFFSNTDFDLVVALGTPCCVVLAERNLRNKAVFAAPPDAKIAGIVADPLRPGGMTTGVTYKPPSDKILHVMQDLLPDLATIGLLHNPAEANSKLVVDEFLALAKDLHLEVIASPVNAPSEVAQAASLLINRVQVLFVPNDNTVHTALESLLVQTNERLIPVVSVDKGSVAKGVLVGVGGDYYEIGKITAELGGRLLKGEDPALTPVVDAASASKIFVNTAAGNRLGIDIPQAILDGAVVVQ